MLTAGQVQMAIDDILDIAKSTVSQIEDTANNKAKTPFSNLKVDDGAFSQVPVAQQLARQHTAAQEVFMETIDGVVRDLANFRDLLIQSAESMGRTDQSQQEMFASFGRRYRDYDFASDAANERGRSKHADDLAVQPGQSSVAGTSAATAGEPTSGDSANEQGTSEGMA